MPEFSFTLNATFVADTQQEAWDQWTAWLDNPSNVEETGIIVFPPVVPLIEVVFAFECPNCTGAVDGDYDVSVTCQDCGHTFTVPHPSKR